MAVGVLLVTHKQIGASMLEVCRSMLASPLLNASCIEVPNECDVDQLIRQATANYRELDTGDGVLVLTDIYGSTPCNIAERLEQNIDTRVVAGLNLPMLIRVMNYPKLNLDQLVEKAVSGGHNGIFVSTEARLDEQQNDQTNT